MIGTDASGTVGMYSTWGVHVDEYASGAVIGGDVPGAGNVISSCSRGIYLTSSNSLVAGNYVGLDATGTSALGNGYAGMTVGGSNNIIGGLTTAARNVVSGNTLIVHETPKLAVSAGLTSNIVEERAYQMDRRARVEHHDAEHQLSLADTQRGHDRAARYDKEAENLRREAKKAEKAKTNFEKRREGIERRLRESNV